MKIERKRLKPVNLLRPLEFSDSQCRRHFAKHLPVEVKHAAFHVEVCNSGACRPLLAGVVPATSWLFGVENGRVDFHIWLEQSPEQVVRDLAIFEKRCKTGRRSSTDVPHEQIEMLELYILVAIAFKVCSMGFQCRDVVIQKVSLKLFLF